MSNQANPLVGLAEIAERYKLSGAQAANRWAGHPAFPAPVATLKQGRVWYARSVDAWADEFRPAYAQKRKSK